MGATYLSLQIRSDDAAAVETALSHVLEQPVAAGLELYHGELLNGWVGVYPTFAMTLEKAAQALSDELHTLILLLLSANEDDFYCEFFRDGKELTFFKISPGRKRYGKERQRLAKALGNLAEVCDAATQAALVDLLSTTAFTLFSSDLLRQFAGIAGIKNTLLSFDYIERNEYLEDMDTPGALHRLPAASRRGAAP